MELLSRLEHKIFGWFKNIPGLPVSTRKWLGDNSWWITIVILVLLVINILNTLLALDAKYEMLGTVANSYYVSSSGATWEIIANFVSLGFLVLQAIFLYFAIKPLKMKQKKGWVLLFAAWLIHAVSIVVNGFMSLSIIIFIVSVLFNSIWLIVMGYFLYEIHGQFAQVEKSHGVKKSK
jgi:hypothetical protein